MTYEYEFRKDAAKKADAVARANENYEWRLEAKCIGMDPNLFFPERGTPQSEIQKAKAVCNLCDVSAECLEYALCTTERLGIFGGLTERERRAIRGEAFREAKGVA